MVMRKVSLKMRTLNRRRHKKEVIYKTHLDIWKYAHTGLHINDTIFQVKLVNAENKDFPTRFPEYSPSVNKVLSSCIPPLSGIVDSFTAEKKTFPPPQLFNITALQKEAHQAFEYSPEQTLTIAQALYENHKCLSYPRTPSRVMGDNNVSLVKGI
jgi:DNA topoisomerase IA